jgi:hypothetical protein
MRLTVVDLLIRDVRIDDAPSLAETFGNRAVTSGDGG